MNARIIDGKAAAAKLRKDIAEDVAKLRVKPGLAVVLVGSDPASQIYVKSKVKQTKEVGMNSFEYLLPETTDQQTLLATIDALNRDPNVHGILVQLPLPKQIDENAVLAAIDPAKDVDGFHVINAGKLATGQSGFVPCTPLGCLILLKETLGDLSGKKALVLGRSNIVGKPMAALLLQENCTVTVAHSKTKNIEEEARQADILVAATGKPEMVKGSWIKPGATVIDVGINRLPDGKIVGDVAFEEVAKIASAITPVPGGVGPMTIACLLKNTLTAARGT